MNTDELFDVLSMIISSADSFDEARDICIQIIDTWLDYNYEKKGKKDA